MWVNEGEEGVLYVWVKRGRRVYMWGNEGEEGVCVGE